MQAHTVGTKTTRIAAKELKGNLADPWIPIRETESAAYNKRPTYRAARSVLFPFDQDPDRFRPPLLLQRHPPDQGHELAARFRVLVRGQGKTEGYFDRLIPIPQEVESFIFDSTDDSPARLAQAFVELAATARNSVLKPALLRYMQAAKDKISFKQPETNDWAQTWANRLEDIVDETFFPTLWESLPILERAEQVDAQIPWRKQLREAVQAIFDEAVDSLPVIDALEYKARANAEGKLYYGLRKHLSIQIETEGAQP
jgi:CRISPR system Cascade subunit CasA